MSDHIHQLEEIDQQQREQEQQSASTETQTDAAFANAIVDAVDVQNNKPATPLLSQEEIEDEEPPRVNLTAVICTAIVAVCATVILCVAQPWKSSENGVTSVAEEEPVEKVESKVENNVTESQRIAIEEQRKAEEQKLAEEKAAAEQKAAEQKAAEQKKQNESQSIVIPSTKPGSDNVYYNCRLIDASSRKLTKDEVAGMSKNELALARNAIYARRGYQFKEANLREFFSKQSWFQAKDIEIGTVELSEIEVHNVNLIKAQEQK